jgi:hypothetical protein
MLHLHHGASAGSNCQGISRRTALKAGFLGLSGLSLPDVLRLRAEAGGGSGRRDTAVILMWLDGGPSQLETYDPKPDAPAEYRGPFGTIQTNVAGVRVCETLPQHARHMDKMVLLRSVHHDNGDHFAAGHWMLTGRFGATALNQAPRFPSVGSYAARVRGANRPGLPAYVGLPAAQSIYLFPGYQGAAYLGPAYNPFDVDRERRYLAATQNIAIGRPRCFETMTPAQAERTSGRLDLLRALDTLQRDVDASGTAVAMDRYQQQALDMILGSRAREAFDIDREPMHVADRYGRGPWGRYTLMARRLVEAGVTFVTVDMPHWDDHSSIQESHGRKLPHVDRAVGALLEDLEWRGMLNDVLVVVMGEFGRTPRLNQGQPGIPVPGRDHWGQVFSVMLAGGGLRTGQVVGASNARAEVPHSRPLRPGDVLATVYHVLGIDPRQTFRDHSGRPQAILDEGQAITEVI